MEGTEIPIGFIVLNKLPSAKSILNSSISRVIFSSIVFLFGCWLFSKSSLIGIFVILLATSLFLIFLIEYLRKRNITTSIAVNLGHPWVEEEHDVNEAEVAYRTSRGWEILPQKGRVRENYEDEELLLIDGDGETILGTAPQKLRSELIGWLNFALAIRDAQNSVDDEIEAARVREESDDKIDVERMWPEITPGELSIKPGAIFRKFSKGKN
jgi:hypothetical protein